MIFDRGSIKWASLMLPEHVKALREWRDGEKRPNAKKPAWDGQMAEALDARLKEALARRRPVSVAFIRDGERRTVIGMIEKTDPVSRSVTVRDRAGDKHVIAADAIVALAPMDHPEA